MAIAVTLEVSPAAPNHGDTVTATYTVTGNNPVPGQHAGFSGQVTLGGQTFQGQTTLTLPATPPLPVSYQTPACPGLSFAVSPSSPAEFTAVVP